MKPRSVLIIGAFVAIIIAGCAGIALADWLVPVPTAAALRSL